MARGRRHTQEQIVRLLQQIDIDIKDGKKVPVACYRAGISEPTYHRWRGEYGSLTIDQAKSLTALQRENEQLKRIVATLSGDTPITTGIRGSPGDKLSGAHATGNLGEISRTKH